jgi:hypothetical protein
MYLLCALHDDEANYGGAEIKRASLTVSCVIRKKDMQNNQIIERHGTNLRGKKKGAPVKSA